MEQINAAKMQAIYPVARNTVEKKEQVVAKEVNPEDAAKLTGALVGLAVTGLAAVALLKKGKGKDVVDDVTKKTAQVVQDVSEQITQGTSVNSAKKTAQKGLSRKHKKIKGKYTSKDLELKLANEKLIKQKMVSQTTIAKQAPASAKSLNQGVKKAPVEVLEQKFDMAAKVKEEAQKSVKEMDNLVGANPTRKAIRRQKYVQNQAQRAEINANHTQEKIVAQFIENEEKAARKAQTIAAQQASPNYAQAQINMQRNSQQAAANAAKRAVHQEKSKPAYKTMMSLLDSHVKAGRTDVAESIAKKALKSSKKPEVAAAQDFLATITK